MGLYNKYILPKVIHYACKKDSTSRQRQKVVPLAKGNVLEIGVGSGLNLPFYNQSNVKHLTAIDPSEDLWKMNKNNTQNFKFGFEHIKAFAENIPADNNSFDTAVITYTLCSISDTNKALEEIRRVLKPDGNLMFCEHGKAPDKAVQKWQNMINPVWKKLGGGCNLNKDIPLLLKNNGFKITELNTMYLPGWKPAGFNYWGIAEPK